MTDRKIRVLFDANPLVRQKTGVGFYTEGLVRELAKIPQLELTGHYFKSRAADQPLPKAANLSYSHNSWLVGMFVKGLRKFGIRLPWELLARRRADVLLFPDFTSWPSIFGTPKMLTIHDLTYIDFPQYVRKRNLKYLRRYVQRDAQNAALVLTISGFTKKRLMAEFGLPAKKILAEPIPPPKALPAKKSAGLPKKFILYVGTIEPRKNISGLVEAYNLLPDELKREHALVIAGSSGWDADDIITRIKDLQAEGQNIILSGYVDEQTRAALYRQATVAVTASFYEGFGMPLLEAMSYGTPVIASDIAVLKEVAGEAALYFNPESVDSIQKCLAKILSAPALRKAQIKKGSAQLKKYSWQTVTSDIFQEIERLVA